MPRRNKPISSLPEMVYGNKPTDDGNFILNKEEYELLINKNPNANIYIKKFTSGGDFLNSKERWCLWINDNEVQQAKQIPFILRKIRLC